VATSYALRVALRRLAAIVFSGYAPITATATGGTTATFVSTSAQVNKSSTSAYNGVTVLIDSDAGGAAAAPEGEARSVSAAGFVIASGTWTVSPVYTTAPATGDTAIFLYGLTKQDIIEAVNDIILTFQLPRYLPVTAFNDGNMEDAAADAATDWPDVDGTITQTKDTTEVLTGTQSLKLVSTSVDHSVRSLSLPVIESEPYFIWTPFKVTAGSLRAQLYDVTNAAEISGITMDENAWGIPIFQGSVPNDCQNLQMRFVSKTASTTAYVDHVGGGPLRHEWDVPSEIGDASNITGISALRLGQSAEAGDSYVWTGDFEPWPSPGIHRDYQAVNSHRVEIARAFNVPLFYEFEAPGTALSAMADTFYASAKVYEAILEGAAAGCLNKLAQGAHDPQRRAELRQEADEHRRAYRGLLDAAQVAQPRIVGTSQRRVHASGSYD
jgi:hypothetical protein